jgi:2-amino-4-hydroxy-6-hydroxymethyldihydropteridine diphosphokinase
MSQGFPPKYHTNATGSDQEFLIAVGSNMRLAGRPLESAVSSILGELEDENNSLRRVSRFFRTPSFPAGSGPDYVNAAFSVAFDGSPQALLEALHRIEARYGRERHERWAARTMDLDLIAGGGLVLPDAATLTAWQDLPLEDQMTRAPEQLILPHPRLQDRAFVLVPLNDVAPDWRHPTLGKTVAQMLADLPQKDVDEVVPL